MGSVWEGEKARGNAGGDAGGDAGTADTSEAGMFSSRLSSLRPYTILILLLEYLTMKTNKMRAFLFVLESSFLSAMVQLLE